MNSNQVLDIISMHRISVFELSIWLGDILHLKQAEQTIDEVPVVSVHISIPNLDTAGFGCCKVCGDIEFANREMQGLHYKSDLHIYNLKRSLQGLQSVISMDGVLTNDDMELEEVSSNDNSDDESAGPLENLNMTALVKDMIFPEGMVRRIFNNVNGMTLVYYPEAYKYTRLKFHHTLFTTCIDDTNVTPWQQLSSMISHISDSIHANRNYWAVILLQSGRFAAAIFDINELTQKNIMKSNKVKEDIMKGYFNNSINTIQKEYANGLIIKTYNAIDIRAVQHKVMRRYTVRAKAGGSQSTHDNKGSKARSMGAQLRRYGEQALENDILTLLQTWQTPSDSSGISYLSKCSKILINCSKSLQHILFQDSSTSNNSAGTPGTEEMYKFSKSDPRIIKQLGFMINKPTMEECCRVFHHCTMVDIEKYHTLSVANPISNNSNNSSTVSDSTSHIVITDVKPVSRNIPIAEPCMDVINESDIQCADIETIDETPLLSKIIIHCCYSNDKDMLKSIIRILKNVYMKEQGLLNQDADPVIEEENPEEEEELDDDAITTTNITNTANESFATNTNIDTSSLQPLQQLFDELIISIQHVNPNINTAITHEELITLYLSQYQLLEHFELMRTTILVAEEGGDIHNQIEYSSLFHYLLNYPESIETFRTPLHIATIRNNIACLQLLLNTGVCNPSKRDVYNKVPYVYCTSTSARNAYRTCRKLSMEYEANYSNTPLSTYHAYYYWNWNDCGNVPLPLSSNEINNQKNKRKEKKKRNKANKKESEKDVIECQRKMNTEAIEIERIKAKQEEEALKQAGNCYICHISLLNNKVGAVQVYDYKLCSAKCVMALRRQLSADAAVKRNSK